jgi:solute carrier family 35, member C2
MVKSSSLAFVLLFAFLFALESPNLRLIIIIACMTIGVVLMVAGETAFNALGFILCLLAAFFSGFRWSLTQILLLRNPATSNPFSTIFFLAPAMFVCLLVLALPVEGPAKLSLRISELVVEKGLFLTPLILICPGIIAFLMTASEFALLQRTSVVTLSICGIFKEVVTISAAALVFGDRLTPINISGLLVTIASIAAYNYIKISKMRADAQKDVKLAQQQEADGFILADDEDAEHDSDLESLDGGERGHHDGHVGGSGADGYARVNTQTGGDADGFTRPPLKKKATSPNLVIDAPGASASGSDGLSLSPAVATPSGSGSSGRQSPLKNIHERGNSIGLM